MIKCKLVYTYFIYVYEASLHKLRLHYVRFVYNSNISLPGMINNKTLNRQ